MKKTALIAAALAFSAGAFAQKSKIYTAKEYMDAGDMKKAVAAINEAVANESTKNDGKAWVTRGEIYEKLGAEDPTALDESQKSYLKVLEVDPKFDKREINDKLIRIAYLKYNEGVQAYQKADYANAEKNYGMMVSIFETNNGKQFIDNKKFVTDAGMGLKFQALSAYNNKRDEHAVQLLEKAKNTPTARDVYIYSALIKTYIEMKNNAAAEKTIAEAKTLFPKDGEINMLEMNYYANSNKMDVFVAKMEEAVKSDPDNAVLQFNLAVTYGNLANPRNANGDPMTKPANAKELEAKAENAYKLAIDADPTKTDYVYNLGALYFNNAADITAKMNEITGTTEADDRKYNELKALRTKEFTKALPHFQKAYDMLAPKSGSLSQDDFNTYRGTLLALQAIYEDLQQSEKSAMIAQKIQEITK